MLVEKKTLGVGVGGELYEVVDGSDSLYDTKWPVCFLGEAAGLTGDDGWMKGEHEVVFLKCVRLCFSVVEEFGLVHLVVAVFACDLECLFHG